MILLHRVNTIFTFRVLDSLNWSQLFILFYVFVSLPTAGQKMPADFILPVIILDENYWETCFSTYLLYYLILWLHFHLWFADKHKQIKIKKVPVAAIDSWNQIRLKKTEHTTTPSIILLNSKVLCYSRDPTVTRHLLCLLMALYILLP